METQKSRLLAFVSAMMVITEIASARTEIPIQNPGFGPVGGAISGTLDLNLLNGPPATVTQQLGLSSWYGRANATSLTNIGFRPGIEVDSTFSAGVGLIDYGLGASLGGLAGLEMPEADLWQPLTGWSLLANTTYTFSIDLQMDTLLGVVALGTRGFGLGLTVGSTTSAVGTFVADTLSDSTLLSITLLGETMQRLTMTYTTDSSPPVGGLGVAIFAGRGVQTLQVSLLDAYRVDNAALSYETASFGATPEPSVAVSILCGTVMLVLIRSRASRRQPWRASFPERVKQLSLACLVSLPFADELRASNVETLGIPIPNSRFDYGGGEIAQDLQLDARDETPATIVRELGTSDWYARSQPACLANGGTFHPGIAIHDAARGLGIAVIQRQPRVFIPHLGHFCDSEAWLWSLLSGVKLAPDCIYKLAVDVDSGKSLDAAALLAQGFGIGLAVQGSEASHGQLVVDSRRLSTLLEISPLRGTNRRVTLTFITGPAVPGGDLTVVIFVTHPPVPLDAEEIQDFRLDNVSLSQQRTTDLWRAALPSTPLEIPDGLPDPVASLAESEQLVPISEESLRIPATPEPSSVAMVLSGALAMLFQRPRHAAAAPH